MTKANAEPGFRAIVMAHCALNPVDWISDWAWTYDPRQTPSVLPFDLFPRQEEFIHWLEERYQTSSRGVVPKSRDMGVTWLLVAFDVHHWLFVPGYKATYGSRKEALVDQKGQMDSIFEKARFILDRLPWWMMPAGYRPKLHDNHLRITNPANGSTFTGEAGDNMGRGGRSTVYRVDEAAFIERPLKVEAAISANADCIVEVSTANGPDGPFAEKVEAGVLPSFRFHWRDDPRKDDAWYQKQVDTLDPVIVASEIDMDFHASRSGILIPMAMLSPASGRALYDDEPGAICIGVDVAEEGRDNSAAVVREGRNIHHAEEWHGHDPTESANKCIALGLEWEKKLGPGHRLFFFVDKIGVGSGVASNLNAYLNAERAAGREHPWGVVGVQVGESAPEGMVPACANLKAALWWRTRLWFEGRHPAIGNAIPDKLRAKLCRELSGPSYTINEAGKIVVERKSDLRKRGVASPNLADALIQTFLWEAMKPPAQTDAERFLGQYAAKAAGPNDWMVN